MSQISSIPLGVSNPPFIPESISLTGDITHRIISLIPFKERSSLTLVSTFWHKAVNIQKTVDKALDSNLHIFTPIVFPGFQTLVIQSLRKIAATSIGKQLLSRLSSGKHPIFILKSLNNSRFTKLAGGLLVVFLNEKSKDENFILKKPSGEIYFSQTTIISTFAHELIHALHHQENKLIELKGIKYQKNAYFDNAEEMLTILGKALDNKGQWIFDPISENAFRTEAGLDIRVSHILPRDAHLKEAAIFGVDAEFTTWIQKGSFNRKEAIGYLTATIRALLHGIPDDIIPTTQRRFKEGNHIKIIQLLLQAGCTKEEGYEALRSQLFKKTPYKKTACIAKQISSFPVHDAIRCKWKRDEIDNLINAFLATKEISSLTSLLQTEDTEGFTPLQLAEKIFRDKQRLWEAGPDAGFIFWDAFNKDSSEWIQKLDTEQFTILLEALNEYEKDKDKTIEKVLAHFERIFDYFSALEKR